MTQLNSLPNYPTPLQTQSEQGPFTSKDWYFFWAGLFQGLAPAIEKAVPLTGSPFTYAAAAKGSFIVSGGTVSLIQFSRDGVTFYNVGQTSGMFTLSAADRLKITYSVAPTVTFVPT
jgi:hypothetical protein